ncbi:MAG: phosphoenolpyruvate carboxykinase (GTP), partial [Spirochaetales bacterium]|nr:phosphoenolpyruvate carboxykinase (GTP) [Spirochaetales bacterium]
TIYFCDDSVEDEEYVKSMSLEKGEERPLAKNSQTIHYDGYGDQARDKVNTKYIVYSENLERMKKLNSVKYEDGHAEIMGIAENIMDGKDAVVKLFCEGPAFSEFTRPCVQFTDSWYVAHSEQILYRKAYKHFKEMANKDDFYRFIHSAGQVDERGCVVNLDKRRIYMDTQNNIVYSMNAQYAGNSVGLKKHSMRLAISQSGKQGWLCEHMFVMACVNEEKTRNTYFAGAFPSACGKTSTAMIPGELVVGDDIAYFRNVDGKFRAVNVEQGIFGIIRDVNGKDDPVIYSNLMKPQEMIFSNVLKGPDNNPYWENMGIESPKEGENHSGPGWTEGKVDSTGKEILLAHANSRYTMRLDYLENFDEQGYNDKNGVEVEGLLYGGRDSDTTVPVEESKSFADGIVLKAATLESETTSATLGQEGVRRIDPMANLDFISYPLGEYVQNNLDFVKGMKAEPKVFSTNYFLLDENKKFCTSKLAKKVWLHWAEGRIHGDFEAYETPTGFIPKYADLKKLFSSLLDEDYLESEYTYQFTFRCDKWTAKLDRAAAWYQDMDPNTPQSVKDVWEKEKAHIEAAKAKYGANIEPGAYKG